MKKGICRIKLSEFFVAIFIEQTAFKICLFKTGIKFWKSLQYSKARGEGGWSKAVWRISLAELQAFIVLGKYIANFF